MTHLRDQVHKAMDVYRMYLNPDNLDWKVMEVGIDGDERPGGNYKLFGVGNDYKTLDFLPRLAPDIVADICDTKLPESEWDLIILSQTLEHVKDPRKAVAECHRLLKPKGHLIVDIPFQYMYHGLPEYDDYWRMTDKGLSLLLREVGFTVLFSSIYEEVLASALARK